MLWAVNSDFQLRFMRIHKTGFSSANSLERDLKDAGAGETRCKKRREGADLL